VERPFCRLDLALVVLKDNVGGRGIRKQSEIAQAGWRSAAPMFSCSRPMGARSEYESAVWCLEVNKIYDSEPSSSNNALLELEPLRSGRRAFPATPLAIIIIAKYISPALASAANSEVDRTAPVPASALE
jgi:hypothetical protein